MKIEAGGQNRFLGWNEIVSTDFRGIQWQEPGVAHASQTITFSDTKLRLNGSYQVNVTFTAADFIRLAPQLLNKSQLLEAARLTDEDKISMAKDVMAKLSSGDKPDIRVLFGLLEAMLPREEVITLLRLTDDEKIALAQETLRYMPFGEVISRLHGQQTVPEQETYSNFHEGQRYVLKCEPHEPPERRWSWRVIFTRQYVHHGHEGTIDVAGSRARDRIKKLLHREED